VYKGLPVRIDGWEVIWIKTPQGQEISAEAFFAEASEQFSEETIDATNERIDECLERIISRR
jgi:hypothetical protein